MEVGSLTRRAAMQLAVSLWGVRAASGVGTDARSQSDIEYGWPMYKRDAENTGEMPDTPMDRPSGESWTYSTEGSPTDPVVVGTHAYVGDADGQLHCIDALRGEEVWSASLDGAVGTSLAADGRRVYAGTAAGTLYGVDRSEGVVDWERPLDARVTSGLTVVDDAVYLGTESTIYAVETGSGRVRWSQALSKSTPAFAPAVSDGTVYVAGNDELLHAVTENDVEWTAVNKRPITGAPVVDGDRVLYGTEWRSLWGVDRASGEKVWEKSTDGKPVGSPVIANDFVFAGTDRGAVYMYSRAGTPYLNTKLDAGVAGQPVVANEGIYVLTTRSELVLVSPDAGSPVWSRTLDSASGTGTALAAQHSAMFTSFEGGTVRGVYNRDAYDARSGIRRLRTVAADTRDRGILVPSVSDFLDRATTQFSEGDYGTASETATEGIRYVETRQSKYGAATDARDELQDRIQDARSEGYVVDVVVEEYLETVREQIEAGEYDAAVETARDGMDRLAELKRTADAAALAIETLADAVEATQLTVPGVEDKLGSARRQYDRGDYQEALGTAREGQSRLETAEDVAADARDAIATLEELVTSREAADLVVDEAKAHLEEAREAYDDGGLEGYRTALETARQGQRRYEETVATAAAARDNIDTLASDVESARSDGLVVDEAASLLARARDRYEAGEYERANSLATEGQGQVETTREKARAAREAIDAAETQDEEQAGAANAVSEFIDDDGLLRRARAAYDDGEYDQARRLARMSERNTKRSRQLQDVVYFGAVALGGVGALYKSGKVPVGRLRRVFRSPDGHGSDEED